MHYLAKVLNWEMSREEVNYHILSYLRECAERLKRKKKEHGILSLTNEEIDQALRLTEEECKSIPMSDPRHPLYKDINEDLRCPPIHPDDCWPLEKRKEQAEWLKNMLEMDRRLNIVKSLDLHNKCIDTAFGLPEKCDKCGRGL